MKLKAMALVLTLAFVQDVYAQDAPIKKEFDYCTHEKDQIALESRSYSKNKNRKQMATLHEKVKEFENYAVTKFRETNFKQEHEPSLDKVGERVDRDLAMHCLEMNLEAQIQFAASLAKSGDSEAAKEAYRNVIVNYTGLAYKSYVKRAEFGLEDIKEMRKGKK